MALMKITYADGSTETRNIESSPELAFDQLFGSYDDETKAKCNIEEVKEEVKKPAGKAKGAA